MKHYEYSYELLYENKIKYFDTAYEAINYIFENRITGKLISNVAYYIYVEGLLEHVKEYDSEEAVIESKLSEFLSFDYAEILKISETEYTAILHHLYDKEVSFSYQNGEIQINQNKED